jgi:plasmid stabilization system protein ParE
MIRYVIKWNKNALKQFDEALDYIKENSIQNANKVELDILTTIGKLLKTPELFGLDKFKIKNDGSFRAFEIHHYRISYRKINNEIRILRIRHTKMCPKPY